MAKNCWRWNLGLASCLLMCGVSGFKGNAAKAQLKPDTTLPVNSMVTLQGKNSIINGGTRAGNNLFHSFEQFSVTTGSTAFFNNASSIQNIITRVTGSSVSNINGSLQANGTANLFLLNPNGIIFGAGAKLDIAGSFVASTASFVKFADGSNFATTSSQAPPLLTVSVPTGLQFESSAGTIRNQSRATNSRGEVVGLQVPPGKTLALIGGNVLLEGGQMTSPGGRIELGSIQGEGLVSLTPTVTGLALGYQGVSNYGDIQLSKEALVDVSGDGGTIHVQGRRVTLTEDSRIASFTFGSQPGGNLIVNASESLELRGTGRYSETVLQFINGTFTPTDKLTGLFSVSFGTGAAGSINIDTSKLIARDGAFVLASTLGSGAGGNLTLNAIKAVELSSSALATTTNGTGGAGNLTINTGSLIFRDAALASTSSLPSATGKGGDLTVNASSIELIGGKPFLTPNVVVVGLTPAIDSALSTMSFGAGNAGNLTINTKSLIVRNGGSSISYDSFSGTRRDFKRKCFCGGSDWCFVAERFCQWNRC